MQQVFATNTFNGLIETVPAYASLAVFFNAAVIRKDHPQITTAFDFVDGTKREEVMVIKEESVQDTTKKND